MMAQLKKKGLNTVPKRGTIVPSMGTLTENNNLSAALFGKTRRAVLSLLYGHADEAFYIRYIVHLTTPCMGGKLCSIQDTELLFLDCITD